MKMLLICGVLLMFTESAEGLITGNFHCTYDPIMECYGALGRSLYLQLLPEERVTISKIFSGISKDILFEVHGQTIITNSLDSRWQFIPENRSILITGAEKRDSGRYEVVSNTSTGKLRTEFSLTIEAVVSSVDVMQSCFFSEDRKVHCYADGDSIQFSWTLNRIPHDQNLTDGNQTLLLDKYYTGNIICHVENHVSSGDATIEIESWSGMMVFVTVWLFEVIILVSLLVGAFYIFTRIKRKQIAAKSKKKDKDKPL